MFCRLLIYLWGFLGKHFRLPQVPLCWAAAAAALTVASTRWRCWCILRLAPAAATEKVQAHIIIGVSANCGDGSVTVNFDRQHIVSITLICRSRPCHRQILCVWSCRLLWNWKWMVINYNDDHQGERFCATGYLPVLVEQAYKTESPGNHYCSYDDEFCTRDLMDESRLFTAFWPRHSIWESLLRLFTFPNCMAVGSKWTA